MKAVVVIALLCFAGSGCLSLYGVDGPPARPPATRQALTCTRSNVIPVIDTVVAAGFIGYGAYGHYAISQSDPEGNADDFAPIANLSIVLGVFSAISAYAGFHKTGGCRAMERGMSP